MIVVAATDAEALVIAKFESKLMPSITIPVEPTAGSSFKNGVPAVSQMKFVNVAGVSIFAVALLPS